MHINVINKTDTFAMFGLGGALAYFHGHKIALAAISSFVATKIIDYMQNRKILSATQEEHRNEKSTLNDRISSLRNDNSYQQGRLSSMKATLAQLNSKQRKSKNRLSQRLIATTEKLRAAENVLSEIEDGDQVEKARTIIEQQEQLQEIQDTQSHLQHQLYDARRIIENLNGKIKELKDQLGFTHSQLLKERARNTNR